MKHISKTQATHFQNSDNCDGYEYAFGDKDVNGTPIHINGRYPDTGRVVNKVCKELAYITKGDGVLVSEEVEIRFAEGDSIMIDAGERYYWDGDFEVFMVCAPAWYPEQHEKVA